MHFGQILGEGVDRAYLINNHRLWNTTCQRNCTQQPEIRCGRGTPRKANNSFAAIQLLKEVMLPSMRESFSQHENTKRDEDND